MDIAYDHIQESNFPDDSSNSQSTEKPAQKSSLNADLQDAYRAFSSSPWGARIGGFLGSVVKQVRGIPRQRCRPPCLQTFSRRANPSTAKRNKSSRP